MCGIGGILSQKDKKSDFESKLHGLQKHLFRRGPDSKGHWLSENGRLGFIHTRLSIIDLSETGHQPMVSQSQRFVLTFNGEIYNYKEISKNLENKSVTLKGSSDTEVLLESIATFGIEKTLLSLRGMFAFAVYDKQEKKVYLARDRAGEKPLYYGNIEGRFVFASQLSAILSTANTRPQMNQEALAYYVKYNYIPAPLSIFENIQKLPPANYATIDAESGEVLKIEPYWLYSPKERVQVENLNQSDWINQIHQKLKEVIQLQLHSDVPVGCFLSGGIDSSLVCALAQNQSSQAIRTFTIGFKDKKYDESEYAKKIAKHLGCQHSEWIIESQDILNFVPQLSRVYDEPFADSSQLPTLVLSQLTRTQVKTALSGDGGDEVFCGYNRYFVAPEVWRKLNNMPLFLRKYATHFIHILSPEQWDSLFGILKFTLPSALRFDKPGQKLYKLNEVLHSSSFELIYDRLLSNSLTSNIVLKEKTKKSLDWLTISKNSVENMMWNDFKSYLPGDILTKVDRATMYFSLESRAPFLDHELIELAWRAPFEIKTTGGIGKIVLRTILKDYVPVHFFERPKMGFGAPIADWLRGPLKQMMQDQLSPQNLQKNDLFDPDYVQRLISDHLSLKEDHQYQLWSLLQFQNWLSEQELS